MCILDSFLRIIIHESKADIWLIKDPNSQWIPVCDKDPLPYIKLLFVNNQWILDIFLNNPISSTAFTNVLENLTILAENNNATTSALMARLYYPQVLISIEIKLSKMFLQFLEYFSSEFIK